MAEKYTLGYKEYQKGECDSFHHYSRESLLKVIDCLISKHSFSLDLYELIITQLSEEERCRFIYLLAASTDNPLEITKLLIPEIYDSRGLKLATNALIDEKPTILSSALLEKTVKKFYYANFRGKEVGDPVYDRAGALCEQIRCSDLDRRILSLFFLSQMYNPLSRIFNKDDDLNYFYSIVAMILSESRNKIKSRLCDSSTLIISKVLDSDNFGFPFYYINYKIFNYLENKELTLPTFKLLRQSLKSLYDLETFSITKDSKKLCNDILFSKSACSLLLYGIPGTGKTEFAKTIAHKTGQPVYFLNTSDHSDNTNDQSKKYALTTSVEFLESIGGILIIDEADSILNSEGIGLSDIEKGWLVDFLDNLKIKTIWISNDISGVHYAVLRRFTSSITFSPFNKEERISLWKNRLSGTSLEPIIKKETIQILSQTYDVNAGGIAKVINSITNLSNINELKEQQIFNIMKTMLDQHQLLMGGKKAKNLKSISSVYDPSILNADMNLSQIESAINKYDKGNYSEPLNILLWGLPGTGKTEYVKYLAQKYGKTLILKRPSDFLSKYVGETENKIADAFFEAEEKDAILFLDEADSFFISREKTERSYEKTQTNELLTQMENFSGILVCSTNNLESLDTAVMRRFSWKVEFKPLKTKDRIRLFKNVFNLNGNNDFSRLENLNDLTPGDMYAVYSRLKFSDNKNNSETIIEELKKECMYKSGANKRVIGF